MTPDDALKLANWVEGLFAEITPQQVEFLADQFESFDVGVVEREVTRFRRQFDVLNISNLLRRVSEEQGRLRPPVERDDLRKVSAQWARDDEAVSRLSDDELRRHKEAVLAEQPGLRTFLADKDPRESVVLRSLILTQRLKRRPD